MVSLQGDTNRPNVVLNKKDGAKEFLPPSLLAAPLLSQLLPTWRPFQDKKATCKRVGERAVVWNAWLTPHT